MDFLREPTTDPETGEVVAPAERCYEAIDLEALRSVVDARQRAYNEASRGQKFELVLFDAALEHLCRISRLLASDRGSALLVGVGGSGKQSLTRLAAHLAGATPFQITITKQYGQAALFEDIKAMYKLAGLKGQKVAFIFSDAEVKDESFLEYINQILMTGAVAGLFPRDEIDAIVQDVRPAMKRESPELARAAAAAIGWGRRACGRAGRIAALCLPLLTPPPPLYLPAPRWTRTTTCTTSSWAACATTSTCACASRLSGPSSRAARRSSRASSTAAPWTGSCPGPRTRSPPWPESS